MAIIKEERIGGQRLILGDCLEVMKELGRFDAVVTDPPYGIDNSGSGYGRAGRTIVNDKDVTVMGAAIHTAVDISDACFMFYSCRNTPDVMAAIPSDLYRGEIIWDKKAPGMGRNIRYQHENIAVLSHNDLKFENTIFSIRSHYRDAELHPHQKPLGIMLDILKLTKGTILDPFMGSGTTLVSCQRMGRSGTGIELDPEYFEIACKRVEEAANQPDLFVEVKREEPEQASML